MNGIPLSSTRLRKLIIKNSRDVILNRVKDYYENDQERLGDQARDQYRDLSEEEKNKTREYEKINIIICLEKRNKNQKNIKKITVRLKRLYFSWI